MVIWCENGTNPKKFELIIPSNWCGRFNEVIPKLNPLKKNIEMIQLFWSHHQFCESSQPLELILHSGISVYRLNRNWIDPYKTEPQNGHRPVYWPCSLLFNSTQSVVELSPHYTSEPSFLDQNHRFFSIFQVKTRPNIIRFRRLYEILTSLKILWQTNFLASRYRLGGVNG